MSAPRLHVTAAADSLRCRAPHPQHRGSECGTVLVLGESAHGVLTHLGVAKTSPAEPSAGRLYIRCSRKACGWWNVFRLDRTR